MNDDWLILEIGLCEIKAAWYDDYGMAVSKEYFVATSENLHGDGSVGIPFVTLSQEIIRKRKAKNVLFVVPPNSDEKYKESLYIVAKENNMCDVMFIDSDDAVIAYYSYLNEISLDDVSIVYNFGCEDTYISYFDGLTEKSSYKFCNAGLYSICLSFAQYIEEKYNLVDVSKNVVSMMEHLIKTNTISTYFSNDTIGIQIGQQVLEDVFERTYDVLRQIKLSTNTKRIILVGEGMCLSRFVDKLWMDIKSKGLDTRIVKDFQTENGCFSNLTAAVLGALNIVSCKDIKGESADYFFQFKQRCSIYDGKSICKYVIHCENCGKYLPDRYNDGNNSFCPYCGKRLFIKQ